MLRICDGEQRLHRRELLTLGSLGLAGLTLPGLFSLRAQAEQGLDPLTGKSVIFIFQQGGPSQFETFDPKPTAPSEIRTVGGTIPTKVSGMHFGSTMPQLAKLADKLTIVRSYQTNNGGHNLQPLVGPDSLETNIGTHFSRVAGATRAETGMPSNCVLFPQAVDSEVTKGKGRGDIRATGSYSSAYAPFVPGAGGQLQRDMELQLSRERFEGRRSVLAQLDRLNRQMDVSGELATMDEFQQQAYRVLLGAGVANALDLSQEDPDTRKRYDTSKYAKARAWNKVNRGKRGYYYGQAKTIGNLLLLSRRLCEAGCGFVTVHAGYDGVWDMHADGNNLNMKDGMQAVGYSFDHAVAALIEDIEARGLSEKILVVACGEMGRTPKINNRGGRDHWSRLAPLLLYGAGMPRGTVIGQSTRDGAEPATDNLTPQHLIATMLQTLFDVSTLRLIPGVPSPVLELAQATSVLDAV